MSTISERSSLNENNNDKSTRRTWQLGCHWQSWYRSGTTELFVHCSSCIIIFGVLWMKLDASTNSEMGASTNWLEWACHKASSWEYISSWISHVALDVSLRYRQSSIQGTSWFEKYYHLVLGPEIVQKKRNTPWIGSYDLVLGNEESPRQG